MCVYVYSCIHLDSHKEMLCYQDFHLVKEAHQWYTYPEISTLMEKLSEKFMYVNVTMT